MRLFALLSVAAFAALAVGMPTEDMSELDKRDCDGHRVPNPQCRYGLFYVFGVRYPMRVKGAEYGRCGVGDEDMVQRGSFICSQLSSSRLSDGVSISVYHKAEAPMACLLYNHNKNSMVDHDCTERLAVRILVFLESKMLSWRLNFEGLFPWSFAVILAGDGTEGCALAVAAA